MRALYEKGVASRCIAERFQTDTSTIGRRLKANGVVLRTPSESRIVNRCDPTVFERHTTESAYWFGFVCADGCVFRNRNRFMLSVSLREDDLQHLEAFRSFLATDAPISYDSNRRSVRLAISSERLIDSLALRGCGPRKSQSLEFPESGLFYRSHFVRGFFDGDGSVFIYRRPYPQPTVSFVGTAPFLTGMQDVLCSDVGLSRNKLYRAGNSEVAKRLSWTGSGNVERIYSYLYAEKGPYLARKKAVFEALPFRVSTVGGAPLAIIKQYIENQKHV